MSLPTVSVRRPVFAATMALLIFVLGIAALAGLPVREFPDVERPVVSVTTPVPSAAAEVVERDVTRVLEDALSEVEGIDLIESTSQQGNSSIDVTFDIGRDLDAAAAEVRDAVSAVINDLPDDAEEPVVAKAAADASAMMWLTLTSDLRDPLALTDLADRRLVDPLSVLPGVARVQIGGELRYAMRVELDLARMAALDITVEDVTAALRAQNIEVPGGRIVGAAREFSVRTDTRLSEPEEFDAIVLRSEPGGRRVTLADVAEISVGPEDRRTAVFSDGEPSVGLGIIRAIGANTLAVSAAVLDEVETLRAGLPADVDIAVSYNEAEFVEESIGQIVRTLAITAALVMAVIFVFLGSPRGAIMPAVTIPVALVGSFGVLYLLGFSVNVLTLLAVVLAVGLVVDDAIVVLENVTRRMEEGEPRLAAAARGAEEVFLPVVATTAVLVAVLAPVAALTGISGRLFTEFAIALMAAIVISSFMALSVGAALTSYLARPPDKERTGPLARVERGFDRLRDGYARLIDRLLARAWLSVGVCVALGAAGLALFTLLPGELEPDEDRGAFVIRLDGPPGSTIEQTIAAFDQVRAIVEEHAAEGGPVEGTTTIVGAGGGGPEDVGGGIMIVRLKPWGERDVSQMALVEEVSGPLRGLPMADVIATNPSGIVAGLGAPVQFVVLGPDYDQAEAWARDVLAAAGEAAATVRLDFERRTPQVEVDVNRALAADIGVDVAAIGEALRVAIGGDDVTEFVYDGETYDVIVRAGRGDRARPGDLGRIELRAPDGALVPLALLARPIELGAPQSYTRVDRQPAMVLSGSPGALPLGEVLERLRAEAAEIVPEDGGTTTLGLSREFDQAQAGVLPIFALALVVVFLTLAALFESFAYPIVILVAVPLAVAGGLGALWVTGASFSIYAQISLLLLVGLLAKNAILVVDFANNRRGDGCDALEAARAAAVTRFRPILMTSIATAFGAVPLALATGAGAEARATIGAVVLAGVVGATAITLLVVPGLYVLVSRLAAVPGRRSASVSRELRESEPG